MELKVAVTFDLENESVGVTQLKEGLTDRLLDRPPSPQTIDEGLQELEKRGFRLTNRGRFSLSMRIDSTRYEQLFGTRLSPTPAYTSHGAFGQQPPTLVPTMGAPWRPDPEIMRWIDDAYIQWPHLIYAFEPSRFPPYIDEYHLRLPDQLAMVGHASQVHRLGYTGAGVTVAMVDSGFYHDHPYFTAHGYRSSVVTAPGATHKTEDQSGHGTAESANVFAIAPDVSFLGIKVDNELDPTQSASMLEGFQEAMKHSPDIITISLGYDLKGVKKLPNNLKALEAEIKAAVKAGTIVIFASGNGHVSFPAMMPEVMSVGGVFVDEKGRRQASDYASAFRSTIYPGRNVPDFCGLVGMSANDARYLMLPVSPESKVDRLPDGTDPDDGWALLSGTSAAAPQIAGLCALLLEKDPSLEPGEVKSIIQRSCWDVTEGHGSPFSSDPPLPADLGQDGATGYGLFNAEKAIQLV